MILLFSCSEKKNYVELLETSEIIETTEEPQPWSVNVWNGNYDFNIGRVELGDGFAFTLKNQSTEDKKEFIITDYSGSLYKIIPEFELSYDSLGFMLSFANIGYFPMFTDDNYDYDDFFGIFYENRNIINNNRQSEDTPERREALAKVFRIYINGELVGGELISLDGNHNYYYYFMFDKYYSLENIDMIRVELGYK